MSEFLVSKMSDDMLLFRVFKVQKNITVVLVFAVFKTLESDGKTARIPSSLRCHVFYHPAGSSNRGICRWFYSNALSTSQTSLRENKVGYSSGKHEYRSFFYKNNCIYLVKYVKVSYYYYSISLALALKTKKIHKNS